MKKRNKEPHNFVGSLKLTAEKIDHEYDAAIEVASVLDGYWREMIEPPYKNRRAFEKAVMKIVKG